MRFVRSTGDNNPTSGQRAPNGRWRNKMKNKRQHFLLSLFFFWNQNYKRGRSQRAHRDDPKCAVLWVSAGKGRNKKKKKKKAYPSGSYYINSLLNDISWVESKVEEKNNHEMLSSCALSLVIRVPFPRLWWALGLRESVMSAHLLKLSLLPIKKAVTSAPGESLWASLVHSHSTNTWTLECHVEKSGCKTR